MIYTTAYLIDDKYVAGAYSDLPSDKRLKKVVLQLSNNDMLHLLSFYTYDEALELIQFLKQDSSSKKAYFGYFD